MQTIQKLIVSCLSLHCYISETSSMNEKRNCDYISLFDRILTEAISQLKKQNFIIPARPELT